MTAVPIIKDSIWRYMTNFWCLLSYAAIVYDFLHDHALGDILPSILVIYIALLTIFVGVKEFTLWHDHKTGRHPGELFVYGWTIVVVGVLIAKIILHSNYSIPGEVISTYIAVLSIMAITQKSKELRKQNKKKK